MCRFVVVGLDMDVFVKMGLGVSVDVGVVVYECLLVF